MAFDDVRRANSSSLGHDPEKWKPVFPRDKREAFARRSCSNNKLELDDESKISHPGVDGSATVGLGLGANVLVGGSNKSVALQPLSVEGNVGLSVAAGLEGLELRPGR